MQILLSNSRAGPGRKVKQEQEEISHHVQAFIPDTVLMYYFYVSETEEDEEGVSRRQTASSPLAVPDSNHGTPTFSHGIEGNDERSKQSLAEGRISDHRKCQQVRMVIQRCREAAMAPPYFCGTQF